MYLIIIIIISIFKEDNVFSMNASLPYGPPVNTDIAYYRAVFGLFIFMSVAMLVVRYLCQLFCHLWFDLPKYLGLMHRFHS